MKKTTLIFLSVMLSGLSALHAQWGVPPAGWTDFAFGLTDESSAINPAPPSRYNNIKIARTAGANFTGLTHRVRYINNGVNTATNWYSWLPAGGIATNYITDSEALGMRPAFNIYMLQEDGGANTAIANMQNVSFMQQYFWNIRDIAQKANGHKAVFVIEPDTWGYLIKKCYPAPTSPGMNDPNCRPNLVAANVNNLGYAFLAGLPNTMAGVAQGIIKTIRTFAPDAYIGFHTNHWATWSNGATGAPCTDIVGLVARCNGGMPFWSISDINAGADFQIAWYKELLGGAAACDKGDFLAVEKYGQDEGARWGAYPQADANNMYYGATQYQNWLHWCKRMGQGINLPLLGWQIPVGISSIPNGLTINAACVNTWNYQYKDGFLEYFFANRQSFICAGFIGLFMGPGVGQAVTYYNTGSPCGDQGYLFGKIRTDIDPIKPLNMNLPSIGACAATSTPTCPLPVQWLSFSGDRHEGLDYLQWMTVSENNNDYFEVEESFDGTNYHSLGRVKAKNRAALNRYHFQSAGRGTTYYRIKQVDSDGQYDYSANVVISDEANGASMMAEIFPNPTSGQISIRLTSSQGEYYSVQIFDVNGKAVYSQENNISGNSILNEVSLEDFPPGAYFAKITRLSDGQSIKQMIIKK